MCSELSAGSQLAWATLCEELVEYGINFCKALAENVDMHTRWTSPAMQLPSLSYLAPHLSRCGDIQ